jgi:hypothetical protein
MENDNRIPGRAGPGYVIGRRKYNLFAEKLSRLSPVCPICLLAPPSSGEV